MSMNADDLSHFYNSTIQTLLFKLPIKVISLMYAWWMQALRASVLYSANKLSML